MHLRIIVTGSCYAFVVTSTRQTIVSYSSCRSLPERKNRWWHSSLLLHLLSTVSCLQALSSNSYAMTSIINGEFVRNGNPSQCHTSRPTNVFFSKYVRTKILLSLQSIFVVAPTHRNPVPDACEVSRWSKDLSASPECPSFWSDVTALLLLVVDLT